MSLHNLDYAEAIKAIVLDFDGVILESVEIKTRAFRALFKDYPEHIERIIRLHREQAGVSRYEKFETIYREYLQLPLSEVDKDRLGREFSAFVAHEIFTCPFVTGALEFLKEQSGRLPIFIVSGTPEGELRDIVTQRNLDRYCRGAYGSPHPKDVLLHQILAENRWQPSEIVFAGDSVTDFEAADSVGVPFIGRVGDGKASPFPDSVRWVVSDLKDLADRWASVVAQLDGGSK